MNTYIGEKSNINIPTDGKLNQFGGKKYKKKTRRKRRRNRRKSRRGGNTSESHKRRMGRIAAINAKRTANKASITPKKRRGNLLTDRKRGISVDIEAAHHLVEEISFDNYIRDIEVFDPMGGRVDLHNIFKHKVDGNPNHFLHYDIREKIHNLVKKIHKDGWVNCDNECKALLKPLIKQEIESTLFILRVLTKSLVQPRGSNLKLKFKLRVEKPLTGIWSEDSNNIVLIPPEKVKPRLIMGLGPSASGKTFWVENLITLLSNSPALKSSGFPTAFLSIDGGIMREESYMYQMIISVLGENKEVKGFSNLVSPGFVGKMLHGTLFSSGKVKDKCVEFLKKPENQMSLYIPETLGGCPFNCVKKVKKYKEITGDDKWIGVLIWQCKENCPYPDETKCKGTIASGKTREIGEGKKYSSTAWSNSMTQGRDVIKHAPGGIFEIHNGGGASLPGKDCISAIKSKLPISDHCTRSTIKEWSTKTSGFLLDYLSTEDYLAKYNSIYEPQQGTEIKRARTQSRGGRRTKRRRKKRTKKKKRRKLRRSRKR